MSHQELEKINKNKLTLFDLTQILVPSERN